MAQLNSYEAAVYYDYVQNMQAAPLPAAELVVDLDHCAFGICRCAGDGTVELLDQGKEPGMRVMALDRLPLEGRDHVLDEIRQAMRRFYRIRGKKDGPAYALPDADPPLCSQLAQEFAPDARRLNALLERSLERLAALQIPEEEIRVLAIGELAAYYPAEFILRKKLSPTPLLPDSRFAVLSDPPGQIVRLGQELYRKSTGHDVALLCLLPDGQGDQIILAEKGQDAPPQPSFCPPVYVSPAEPQLLLQIDGQDQTIPLPFAAAAQGDLVKLACRVDQGGLFLLIRRTLDPENTYEIPIRNREETPS